MARLGPTSRHAVQQLAGSLLLSARIKTGASQEDLATRAQLALETVQAIESGQVQPDLPTLVQLLAALDLELRTHLEPYDNHDDVLDANYAAMSPPQRAATDARHEALIALVDASRVAPA